MQSSQQQAVTRAQAKRAQVLAAAQDLFLERGFGRTSMEAIRERAGVSKPTLYSYFPSKEALFVAVVTNLREDTRTHWVPTEAATVPLNSREDLRDTLTELAHWAITSAMRPEMISLVRVVIAEAPTFPRLSALTRETFPAKALIRVCALLEQGERRGLVHADDLQAAARLFAGALLSYLITDGLLVGDGRPEPPSRARIEAIVELYLRAISPPHAH